MFKKKIVVGYKGFDKDLRCHGLQYEVGKKYKHNGEIELCKSGFHFCENPLDVFDYYGPAGGRFAKIEAEDVSEEKGDDSKRVAKKIKIVSELSIHELVDLCVGFILERANFKNAKGSVSRERVVATDTSHVSVASNTANKGIATNAGHGSIATNTGDLSIATNTGYESAATNTGARSIATNAGHGSIAANAGYSSVATNTGYESAATNTGARSIATNAGHGSAATNTGARSIATNGGDRGAATNDGEEGCAISLGIEGVASGKIGCFLTIAEWRQDEEGDWHRIDVQTKKVDGEEIKPDILYKLQGGKFVAV